MKYPLAERIGNPDLLVGREEEFELFYKWIDEIPPLLSISRVILARRKSGKTAFIQRIFNKLWNDNGKVIPFFFSIPEEKIWLPEFANKYFINFASQYISFIERDETVVNNPLRMNQIKEYASAKSIKPLIDDIERLEEYYEKKRYSSIWDIVRSAPDRYSSYYDQRILVIIDEFQYISNHICHDAECQTKPDESMPGGFHDLVESKKAPMLVTGSYVGWMIDIMSKYLEAGRLHRYYMNPYLKPDEGLKAVYKYASSYNVPITNEAAAQINELCMSDAFFIACVFRSDYKNKDLTTGKGIIETVNFEITNKYSRLSGTWNEYIEKTVSKINDVNAKNILLYLSKYCDREWTPTQLKEALHLDLSVKDIHIKLEQMVQADLIQEGNSDIDYKGLTDGTLYLVLRHRFEKEISEFMPDLKIDFQKKLDALKQEKQSIQGKFNNLVGKVAEYQLSTDMRTRKRFSLSLYFADVSDDTRLNIINTSLRVKFQRKDGKEMEIDIVADSDCGRTVLIEVKKWSNPVGVQIIRDFIEKVEVYSKLFPKRKIIPAFFSLGGFTKASNKLCKSKKIGTASVIPF